VIRQQGACKANNHRIPVRSDTASYLRIVRTEPTNAKQESRQAEMPGNERKDFGAVYPVGASSHQSDPKGGNSSGTSGVVGGHVIR
jgi:hypothetical protein